MGILCRRVFLPFWHGQHCSRAGLGGSECVFGLGGEGLEALDLWEGLHLSVDGYNLAFVNNAAKDLGMKIFLGTEK